MEMFRGSKHYLFTCQKLAMTVDGYFMLKLMSNANVLSVDVMCFSYSYTAQFDLQQVLDMQCFFEELWFNWFDLFCLGIDKGGVCQCTQYTSFQLSYFSTM